MKRYATAVVLILTLALGAGSALAAKAPHRYALRHGHQCRTHYRRVKHGRKVYCVKRKTKAPAAIPAPASPTPPQASPMEKVKLHAHLDPTYTRNPLNPFEVTYEYSASASQQAFSAQSVALGGEAPAPLPSGVLALYSDGRLECAVNVGSGVEGSECPVSYSALGQHTVTTIYSSGEQSATETETESIAPLGTETHLVSAFAPEAPVEVGASSGLWRIGTLNLSATGTPSSVNPVLNCGGFPVERLTADRCLELVGSLQYVYASEGGPCNAPVIGDIFITRERTEPGDTGVIARVEKEPLLPQSVEEGVDHVRAELGASGGYASSEAVSPILFKPEVSFTPTC